MQKKKIIFVLLALNLYLFYISTDLKINQFKIMKKQLLMLTLALCGNMLASADNVQPVKESGKATIVKKFSNNANRIPAMSAADQNIFWEDFEGWSGSNKWLPEGWKDESKVGHSEDVGFYDQDLTWQTMGKGDQMIPVHEGVASAFIMASNYYSTTPYEEQDEWLISPAISVREKDYLYFFMHYSPSYTLYNHDKNDFSSVNSHLEVLVSENGADWTPLWSVVDEVKNMTEEELREDLYSDNLEYEPFYIDLKDWSNKTVQFAFRYTGSHGKDIAIDNIAVGLPIPTTYYLAPLSAMYVGLSPATTNPKTPYMVLPAYASENWESISSSYKSVKWTYTDENGNKVESSDETLTTPAYEPSFIETPSLQAFFNESASEVYQSDYNTLQIGGSAYGYQDVEGNTYDYYGLANYNCMDPNVEIKFNRTIGFDENSIDKWCGLLGITPYEFEVRAISNFYGKPASPYVLRDGYVSLYVEKLRDDAELVMQVRKIDEDGIPAEIIGEAVCYAEDIVIPNEPAYTHAYFSFNEPIVIDSPILVEITGFDTTADAVYVPALFTNTISNVAPVYMSLDTENGPVYFPLSDLRGFSNEAHIAGVAMSIGVEYPWLANNGETITIESGNDGLSQELSISTSTRPDDLLITRSLSEGESEWVTVKIHDYDATERVVRMTLNVAPNTGADRTTALDIYTDGIEKPLTYRIRQSEVPTSIESASAAEDNVMVDGDKVIIDSSCAYVSLFNAAGAKVNEYALNGHNVIDMSSLNKGVYVLLFSNGNTVKVIR